MMSHSARVQQIAEQFRATSKVEGWKRVKLARIGDVNVHAMPLDVVASLGVNEVWVRIDGVEYRGTAEKVAKELCKRLQAPSKAVGEEAEVLMSKKFDGFREPEMAVIFSLDEETTFKAMTLLEERGVAENKGNLGWFRTV